MYYLSVSDSFSAAHRLCGYEGACSNLHGHNWKVRVCLEAQVLDNIGMAMDYGIIKHILQGILAELDHAYLNEVPCLDGLNPTSENLARYIYERMAIKLQDQPAQIFEVEICESERSSVVYRHV
ncbi:MAG: 6-carboxytetrahydropterin synthase QueD [Candidatus Cloacimonas sp.]|jgi:6-pyruvoyltetrahydropterin/6-carboxytetrahydropterin synthase|nr:6-carboxytetrahydropterin synthase QueD [Candidatus Cloacimonas sp.]